MLVLVIAAAVAQQPPPAGAVPARPQGGGMAARRPLISSSVRLEDWALMRSAANAIVGWKAAAAAGSFRDLTFHDAAAKVDALGLANVIGGNTQNVSHEIPKKLDYRLAPGELEAVRDRLAALNMRMPGYFTTEVPKSESGARKLFEFAKSLGVETIVCSPEPALLPMLEKLADEFSINVALFNASSKDTAYANPTALSRTLASRSKRLGAAVDTGNWLAAGVKPLDGLAALGERILAVNLRDHSTLDPAGRDVTLGTGAGAIPEFLTQMAATGLKPSFIAVGASGAPDVSAGLARSFDQFDKALHPILARRVMEMSRATAIRGPERLSPEEKRAIEAALPTVARAKPRKPRKLLVIDFNVAYGGHRSIPHANYAIELMGKRTGAYEPVFSNDLDNLKHPRIRQFDAIYLNNTVGMVFIDPEVREGLTRFVREGGGLMGNHGVSHASMDWPEFGEMIGVKWGVHREATELAMVHVEEPGHPLTAAFNGRDFLYQDEYFRFPIGPYSRDKLRVLLTIDVANTDMNQGRPCNKPCSRPDHDYGVSWIRSYGKGRVFFCILGHNPTIYSTPALAEYFLSGIQFILGDLPADTTPSAKLGAKVK
jgi:type 1 glutamine amidotransferase/sugar phosphate isomerase/epimerase